MGFIRKLRRIVKKTRNIIRWIPILWYDENWDYYFIYNILQKKLEFVHKDMLKSHLENNELYANKIMTAIRLIEIVRDEKYLDEVLREDGLYDWNRIVEKHKKAKRVLFNYLHHNIESWWT